ncbi:hypothetical protein FACS1894195_1040 [Bacteroidia bacterium]|nr:hypothetical protein FACS1894195_1040 [Bacteroidia bacterium]
MGGDRKGRPYKIVRRVVCGMRKVVYLCGVKHNVMMELILKRRISRSKMDALLTFLNTWGIDAEVKPISRKPTARERHIAEFKEAIQQTEVMVKDIQQNGTKGYKTLDDLLAED